MADWNAATYLAFEDARTRPAADLLGRVDAADPSLVVDLGCGPGNSTELLVRRFPSARVIGVDTSPDMLAAARRRLPATTFVQADVAEWLPPRPADLLFANAVLQWVPDHGALLPRLMGLLATDGWLAVQMPDNLAEPTHRLMREVAAEGPWAAALAGVARHELPDVRAYYGLLAPFARRVDIWRTTYMHVLDDAEAVVRWVEGTGLRPYLDPLGADDRARFRRLYGAAIAGAYPAAADGKVILPFPRLFLVAQKGQPSAAGSSGGLG